MPTRSRESPSGPAQSDATLKKEERAREGAEAMREYLVHNQKVRENTARLKALRLAKEAAEKVVEPVRKRKAAKR